jgi:hypothetical protein
MKVESDGPFQVKHVLWMHQHSIRGCPSQQCDKTPRWHRWGGAPLRDSKIRLCSNMVQSLRENGRCSRSPLFLFAVVQEWVGFDRLQTLFYYLKLPPGHIIPCSPDCRPCCQLELPPFCGQDCECCRRGLCEYCPHCSHESSSNCL